MNLGLSYRSNWNEFISDLAIDRFSLIELVPFSNLDQFSEKIADSEIDLFKGKEIWLHLTSVSTGDDPVAFKSRLKVIKNALSNPFITGVSLHCAVQFDEGQYLIQPFPISNRPKYIDNSSRNIDYLARMIPGKKIAIENISCGFDFNDSLEYYEAYQKVLSQSEVLQLLDVTNLWNTSRNLGQHFTILFQEYIELAPIAYFHVGGSKEINGKIFDSHDTCTFDPIIQEVLTRVNIESTIVFEQDFNLNDKDFITSQVRDFIEKF